MNFISIEKEYQHSLSLIKQIESETLLYPLTIINCAPEWSSRLSHLLSHKLSYLNGDIILPTINLPFPENYSKHVWDEYEKTYTPFEPYLRGWCHANMETNTSYLFTISSIFSGKWMNKLRTELTHYIKPLSFRFASLYVREDCPFVPHYYVQKFTEKPLFFWENSNL